MYETAVISVSVHHAVRSAQSTLRHTFTHSTSGRCEGGLTAPFSGRFTSGENRRYPYNKANRNQQTERATRELHSLLWSKHMAVITSTKKRVFYTVIENILTDP